MNGSDRALSKTFVDSTPLLDRPEELRARAESDGYLFFRDILDKDQLLHVRVQILQILQRRGLMDSRYPLHEGIADFEAVNRLPGEEVIGFGVLRSLYEEVQRLQSFHALSHMPELIRVFRELFGEEVFPHPRNIARIMLPHLSVKPTPPHQDFIHIQGTSDTWTAWFPLGDCPLQLGGLSMLEGSRHCGVLDVASHPGGAGGLESILCELNLDWVEGDYRLGDVIVFHSQTVHKALPNMLGNQVRLSCDFRYQPASQIIDRSSLFPHGGEGCFTWDDLYEGWDAEELKYYWEKLDFRFSEWDPSILWQKEKIC